MFAPLEIKSPTFPDYNRLSYDKNLNEKCLK